MVLAAHERQQREYRMDKEHPVFSPPFPVYRQSDLPMFTPMMPFIQPGLRHVNPNFRQMVQKEQKSPENLTSTKKLEEEARERRDRDAEFCLRCQL
jgi:hypothetical protein